MSAQFILIVWVTFVADQPPQVYSLSGNFDLDTCRALIPARVQVALQECPGANVRGECIPMVKK